MNAGSSPTTPPVTPPPFPLEENHVPWRDWARRLLVCNPFFLCSAALLLFALNRLSVDPEFLEREESKLLFNFTAIQLYQFLVVGTALVLARRRIWYDSALLVAVENGLAIVPFMLVSQAAMIDRSLGAVFVSIGTILTMLRVFAVRRGFPTFNLPGRLLLVGTVILAVNVALPLRLQAVVRATTVLDWEPYNAVFWQYVLPVLVALVNLLNRPKRYGGLDPERHWLPIFLVALWLAATALHGWSCAYIGKQTVTTAMLAPLSWIMAWTLWNRLTDFVETPAAQLQGAAFLLPLSSPWLAIPNPALFAGLMAANAMVYGAAAFLNPARKSVALPAAYAASILCIAGLPMSLVTSVITISSRAEWIGLLVGGLVTVASLRKFVPLRAVLGGICVGIGAGRLVPGMDGNLALQAAGLFVVLHSLLWIDTKTSSFDTHVARYAGLIVWGLAAITRDENALPSPAVVQVCGALVLALAWWAVWRLRSRFFLIQIPVAAAIIGLWPAGAWIVQNGSSGILALIASLLLFASGCALAWTRSRWER